MTLNMVSSGSSKSSIILVLIAVQVLISCQHRENEQTIRVAAAASTKFALDSLILNFERSQPYQCRVSYASSGLLTSQIAEGAPFDIFLSADETYGQHLHEAQIAQPPIRYAQGRLVIWSLHHQLSDSTISDDLLKMRKIAVPNPRVAPYGLAAREVLESMDLFDVLEDKLVYGESVGQASHFISSGASDGGFTALSIIRAEAPDTRGSFIIVADNLYSPLHQTFSLLNDHREGTSDFARYLLSREAVGILDHFGYGNPVSLK